MSKKRLFLFAGYNKSGAIDPALIHYVKSLSEFGEIVLVMDSDCPNSELSKLDKYCLFTSGERHGEYDFGSYKRAYQWATENLNLSEYDFIYLVNDSVYGPLYNLAPYINKMESWDTDAFGIVKNPKPAHPHIQSWFIGLQPSVFLTDWFDKFIRSVSKQPSKGLITKIYEHGLSKLIIQNNLTWKCLYTVKNRGIYNKIKKLYNMKMPFMKKLAFSRHNGTLGRQILYVLRRLDDDTRIAILISARGQYGSKYIDWLLTNNPAKIFIRQIKHITKKICSRQL